jgi:hypothetical protein
MRSILLAPALSWGLGEWIRTTDLTVPNGTRFQLRHSQALLFAALRRLGRAWVQAVHGATDAGEVEA